MRTFLSIFCFSISCACFAQTSQQLLDEMERMEKIKTAMGNYTMSVKLLQPYVARIKSDSTLSELFDWLGNLYFLQRDWNSIISLYKDHPFSKGEDSTLLTLAHFFRN